MALTTINFELPANDRIHMRETLITKFLEEAPGNGTGNNASRYQYNVETYNEYGIFLKRPTRLNKGFDFTVNIKNVNFRNLRIYSNPSHRDIFNTLEYCKNTYPDGYCNVKNAIDCIYNCNNIDLNNINAYFIDFAKNIHPIQIILLAIKWLFLEQDCAYWNYSGRAMLFRGLKECDLA